MSLERYQLVEKIATGGMADIHVALQRGGSSFVRTVIVKKLHAHLAEQGPACAAFESEGRILALLDHPAIPYIVDFGIDGDCPYLVMQHLRGPTLKAAAEACQAAGQRMPTDVCLSIGVALCDALAHAHERCDARGRTVDLVHLDLTPSNVVLRPSGQVGLIDFGIATTARDRRNSTNVGVRGTPGYMSPEQFTRRHDVDRRADIFLLGTLLWEMLVGRPLFPSDDLAFFEAITRGTIRSPCSEDAHVPRDLEEPLMRALARDPSDRYEDARALGQTLSDLAARAGMSLGPARLSPFVQELFPMEGVVSHLPEAEHGADDIPELTLLDEDGTPIVDIQASLSAAECRDLLDDLDMFAEPLGASMNGEPPRPPSRMLERQGSAGSDDSGVYMQLEPVVDQVFGDD